MSIVSVLLAVAIPVFSTQLEKAREATDLANMRDAKAAAVAMYLDDNENAGTYYWDAEKGTLVADKTGVNGYGKGTAKIGSSGNRFFDSTQEVYNAGVDCNGRIIKVIITDPEAANLNATIALSWDGATVVPSTPTEPSSSEEEPEEPTITSNKTILFSPMYPVSDCECGAEYPCLDITDFVGTTFLDAVSMMCPSATAIRECGRGYIADYGSTKEYIEIYEVGTAREVYTFLGIYDEQYDAHHDLIEEIREDWGNDNFAFEWYNEDSQLLQKLEGCNIRGFAHWDASENTFFAQTGSEVFETLCDYIYDDYFTEDFTVGDDSGIYVEFDMNDVRFAQGDTIALGKSYFINVCTDEYGSGLGYYSPFYSSWLPYDGIFSTSDDNVYIEFDGEDICAYEYPVGSGSIVYGPDTTENYCYDEFHDRLRFLDVGNGLDYAALYGVTEAPYDVTFETLLSHDITPLPWD